MQLAEKHTSVLIVGAGPSGLMMAAQLLRYGIQPVIIDSRQGPTNLSKALVVQARSLEIYRQMGLINRVLEEGKPTEGVAFYNDEKEMAALSLMAVGTSETAFPFIHLYPQSKNEKLLLDYLTLNCCPVYWDTTLVSLKQNTNSAKVQLQYKDQLSALTCDWVTGADGAHSTVRKELQIPFSGDTYAHQFFLADVELGNQFTGNKVQFYLAGDKFAGIFPMPEQNRYRVIGKLPGDLSGKGDIELNDVLPYLKEVSGVDINVLKEHWFTIYKLHHRMAESFSRGRCFLVGDAAHIHSPVGGQGMNTGLQDAYNLAWKLAGVINRQLDEKILDTYAAERMPVAKTLLSTTDRIFTMVTAHSLLGRVFKKWVLPKVLNFVWSKNSLREEFFKRVSQIGIAYRNSSISLHLSQSTKIKAGDRLPYLKIFDEKKQQETDLHEWCSKPGFTFIILGKLSETDLFALAKWITQNYPSKLNFFYLPLSAKNQHVFDAFGINANQGLSLIVRPDMHIGFMNDKADMFLMDNYLKNIVGMI